METHSSPHDAPVHPVPSEAGGASASQAAPNVLITDAATCSPRRFLDRARPMFAPAQTAVSEKADAARAYIAAMFATPEDQREAIREAFEAEKAAIDARWMHRQAMESAVAL